MDGIDLSPKIIAFVATTGGELRGADAITSTMTKR